MRGNNAVVFAPSYSFTTQLCGIYMSGVPLNTRHALVYKYSIILCVSVHIVTVSQYSLTSKGHYYAWFHPQTLHIIVSWATAHSRVSTHDTHFIWSI